MCYQEYDVASNYSPNDVVDDTLKHYHGDTYFQEKLKSCVYAISPFVSFFQVNTKGLEKLYALVIKCCKEDINDDGTYDDETMKDVETKDANEENRSKDSSRDSGICFKGLRWQISWCMSHGMRNYDPWTVEEYDLTVAWRNQENIVKASILGWHDVSRK